MSLATYLTEIADALREKKGTEGVIPAQSFADEIRGLSGKMEVVDEEGNAYKVTNIEKTTSVSQDDVKQIWQISLTDKYGSRGLIFDNLGNVYAQTPHDEMFVVSPSGELIRELTLNHRSSTFVVGSDGSLYVGEGYESVSLYKYSATGESIWYMSVSYGEYYSPHDVVRDKNDNIFIRSGYTDNQTIQKYTSVGDRVFSYDPALNSEMGLDALAVTPEGEVFFTENEVDAAGGILCSMSANGERTQISVAEHGGGFHNLFIDGEKNFWLYEQTYSSDYICHISIDGKLLFNSPMEGATFSMDGQNRVYVYSSHTIYLVSQNKLMNVIAMDNTTQQIVANADGLYSTHRDTTPSYLRKYTTGVKDNVIAYLQEQQEV